MRVLPHARYSVHIKFYLIKNDNWEGEYLHWFILLAKAWHKHGINVKMSSLNFFPEHRQWSQFYLLFFCLSVRCEAVHCPGGRAQGHLWIHSQGWLQHGFDLRWVWQPLSTNYEIINSVSPWSNKWHSEVVPVRTTWHWQYFSKESCLTESNFKILLNSTRT